MSERGNCKAMVEKKERKNDEKKTIYVFNETGWKMTLQHSRTFSNLFFILTCARLYEYIHSFVWDGVYLNSFGFTSQFDVTVSIIPSPAW